MNQISSHGEHSQGILTDTSDVRAWRARQISKGARTVRGPFVLSPYPRQDNSAMSEVSGRKQSVESMLSKVELGYSFINDITLDLISLLISRAAVLIYACFCDASSFTWVLK